MYCTRSFFSYENTLYVSVVFWGLFTSSVGVAASIDICIDAWKEYIDFNFEIQMVSDLFEAAMLMLGVNSLIKPFTVKLKEAARVNQVHMNVELTMPKFQQKWITGQK